jgi:hypothetical protein
MAISHVASENGGYVSSKDITINKPTGTVEGDFMIAHIQQAYNSSVGSTPSGWTRLGYDVYRSSKGDYWISVVYYKEAGSSEGASYTFSGNYLATISSGVISTFRGVQAIGNSDHTDSAGSSYTAPSITIQEANNWAICTVAISSNYSFTQPSGYTELVEIGDYMNIETSYKQWTSSGATGNQTGSISSSDDYCCWHIELEAIPPPPETRSYQLHYYKGGVVNIDLWDKPDDLSVYANVYFNSETSYAELVSTGDPDASDLRIRKDGTTYAFILGGDSTSSPPVTSAFAEAFIHEDTAAATNRSNTSEADVALTGAADLEQGDWSGQWTAPDLTLPENNLYLTGYCDFLQQSGTQRSGALCQLEVDGTKAGIFGVSTWGYNRNSGGADESTRHMVSLLSGTLNEVYTVREATQLNSSDRVGDYNRTSGDPRGMWSLNLKGASDYLVASSSTTDNASGVIGNSPRPIDLGTPSSLSAGSWKAVTFSTTDDSNGSTITRSTNTFTVAANSVVLCHFVGQFWGAGPRKAALIRMDIDGSPYAYTSCYMRNASMDGATCSITMPVITGGSSVDVTFSFVDQAETTTEFHMDMRYKAVSFIDFTGQDIVLLEQGTTDITGIDGATPDTVSWPVADEIQVDSSFDHPVGNLTRIENDAGEEITVLAGFCFLADRSVATSGNRQFIAGQLVKTGTDVDYCIAGETSRGSQGDDDCFIAGASYCAPVVLGTSDYLELDIKDIAQNTGGCMINCSDEKALYMWAIRIDN